MSKSYLTKASILLLPGVEISETILTKLGLINCFIGDEDYDGDGDHCLFLLFKDADQILLGRLISNIAVKDDYDVGEFTMIVVDWPEKWNLEWNMFMDSKYSHFRPLYKQKFSSEAPPLPKKVVKRSGVSYGWLIVNKHKDLKEFQEKRIGMPLEDWQEVSSAIDIEDEVFQYQRFKEKYYAYIGCQKN